MGIELINILMQCNILGKYLGLKFTALKVKRNEELSAAFKMLLSPNIGRWRSLIVGGQQECPNWTLLILAAFL